MQRKPVNGRGAFEAPNRFECTIETLRALLFGGWETATPPALRFDCFFELARVRVHQRLRARHGFVRVKGTNLTGMSVRVLSFPSCLVTSTRFCAPNCGPTGINMRPPSFS